MSVETQNENLIKLEPICNPLFPKAMEILFFTGNTLTLKLIKKTNTTITDEICETISMMLQTLRTDSNLKQFENESYVKILSTHEDSSLTNNHTNASPDQEQLTREDLKYSVKIFLRSLDPQILSHTIDTVLTQLKENYLENVMISLPNYSSQVTLDEFLPLWRIIEDFIDKQKILSAGVCDFMMPLFSDLCQASKHKPYADQINLGVCCSIPDELNKYVKEHNIQLLTHSDPIDAINESDFQGVLRDYCHEKDAVNWKPLSIVRYNCVIANRGIIKTKGFLIYARR